MSDAADREGLRAQARTVTDARVLHQDTLYEAVTREVAALAREQRAHDQAVAAHEEQNEQRRNIAECTTTLEEIARALRTIPHQATP